MSFAIAAIYNFREALIGADCKMVNQFLPIQTENADKIAKISPSVAIALTGNVRLATAIIEMFKIKYKKQWSFERCIDELAKSAEACHPVYMEMYHYDAECALLLSAIRKRAPHIAILLLIHGHAQVVTKPFRSGLYQFLFASPEDYPFEDCLRLCTAHFALNSRLDPTECVEKLIPLVAKHSDVVNDIPNVWQARRTASQQKQ